MAAVTFWKGTLAKYQEKVTAGLVDGRLYFIEDSANPTTMGALYLKDQLIAPQRLTALTLETADNVSSVTAKAVVDFVKANFDAKGAYDQAISDINGKLAGIEGTVADAISGAVSEAKGTIDAYTVNGKAISTSPVLAAADIEDVYSKTEVDGAIESAIEAVIGGEGDLTLDGINGRLETVEGKLDDVEGKVGAAITTAVSGLETTINGKLDNKVESSVYEGKVSSIEGRLDATEGVANGAAAAVATKVEQSTYDTKMGEVDAALADRYTKGEADGLLALKANAADVYTKEEVGNMLSAALEFKGTVDAVENLPEAGETGDVYYVKADQSEYVWVDATHKWEKLGPVVDYTQFAQASNVYTKGEVDGIVDGLEGRLDATEGVANGAAAAVATKVEQEAYNTKMGELDGAIADRYTKSEVYTKGEVDSAISAASLVWVED